jgi:hypothetical protein
MLNAHALGELFTSQSAVWDRSGVKSCKTLRLLGSLYSLLSGRAWGSELGKQLDLLGFQRTESDWGLYYRTGSKERRPASLLAYVDEVIVAAR